LTTFGRKEEKKKRMVSWRTNKRERRERNVDWVVFAYLQVECAVEVGQISRDGGANHLCL
jgi:hypothetical protein